jgi:hypothetical protein
VSKHRAKELAREGGSSGEGGISELYFSIAPATSHTHFASLLAIPFRLLQMRSRSGRV